MGPGIQLRGWRIQGVRFPYRQPVKWNDNVLEEYGTYALLRLETSEGLTGVGEATVKPTWTGVSVRSVAASLEDVLLPRLQGVDLADPHAVAMALASVPENQTAKMLIDHACWDIRCQVLGQPLWQTLDGRPQVDLSWTLTRNPAALMGAEAEAMVGQYGFETLKIKGGQGLEVDVDVVRTIRKAVGERVQLYVDANWHYSVGEGMRFAAAMADAGVCLLEDPWALKPDAALRRAVAELPIPILVDYFCVGPRDVAAFSDAGAAAFSIKPGRIGISDALEMSRLCQERGARRVTGLFAETMLGSLHTLSFASTIADRLPAESSFFLALRDSPLVEPLTVKGGRLTLPAKPGIAPWVDWGLLERCAIH